MCSYNGQEDGRVGLYVAAEPLTRAKNYFEVEILESGVMGAIGKMSLIFVILLSYSLL